MDEKSSPRWNQWAAILLPAAGALLGSWHALQSGMTNIETAVKLADARSNSERQRIDLLLNRSAEKFDEIHRALQAHDQQLHDLEYWLRAECGQDKRRARASTEPGQAPACAWTATSGAPPS